MPQIFDFLSRRSRFLELGLSITSENETGPAVKPLTFPAILHALIDSIYRQSIIQNDLMVKQAEDIKEFTMAFIRRMEEN